MLSPKEKIKKTFEEGYLKIHDRLDIVQMVKNFDDLKIFINKNLTEELSNAIENNKENVIVLDES